MKASNQQALFRAIKYKKKIKKISPYMYLHFTVFFFPPFSVSTFLFFTFLQFDFPLADVGFLEGVTL